MRWAAAALAVAGALALVHPLLAADSPPAKPPAMPPSAAAAPKADPAQPANPCAAPLSALDLALREAAADGDASRTADLLKQGAKADSTDADGLTPLMIAVVGDVERVRAIAEKGLAGDVWQKGLKKVIKAMKGDAATLRVLLDHGAEVNAATPRGITALGLASLGGKPELVRLLLDRGAEVDARAKRGETALMVASAAGHNPVVQLLLERGADPMLKTRDGINAVMAAVLGGHPETVELLTKGSKPRSATF